MNGAVIAKRYIVDRYAALKLASDYVRSMSVDTSVPLIIFPENTETHDFGWVVYYGSSDPDNPVVGNAPLIIDRNTGRVHETGTSGPTSEYIRNFRQTGDPHAGYGNTVVLEQPGDDARRIDAVVTIRDCAHLSLGDAKKILENCLAGRKPSVELGSIEMAAEFTKRLSEMGFTVRRLTAMR